MHRFIRERLEDLLAERTSATGFGEISARQVSPGEIFEHLGRCTECASEVEVFRDQAELLKQELKAPEMDPAPGFYARVIQRIEETAKGSIWAVFIYSPFGRRLAFASLGLALVMGSYLVGQEIRDGHWRHGESMIAQGFDSGTAVFGDQDEQRNAVLVNFAAQGTSR
jgi:hypothetical protein